MIAVLRTLAGSLAWSIPVSMAVGLAAGMVVDLGWSRALIVPLTFLMIFPMLVNVRLKEALGGGDSRLVATAMAINFAVVPMAGWFFAHRFFPGNEGLFVGMVLVALFPTSGMTISWTGFARGNVVAAVKMTVIGLLAAAVLAPVYLRILAGQVVPIDVIDVGLTLAMVVLAPLAAAQLTRRTLVRWLGEEHFRERIVPALPGASALGVLGVVFIAVGLQARAIVEQPLQTLLVILPLLMFYALNFVVSTLVGRAFFSRVDAVALVYGTVMRNLSIALGVALAEFGPQAALVLAAAYVVQVQTAAWYVRLVPRAFSRME